MAIEIVQPLSEMQRDLIAPHLEAYRRFERIIVAWKPAPDLKFDIEAMCYYREVAEPPPGDDRVSVGSLRNVDFPVGEIVTGELNTEVPDE